jgi:hypothetical protein
LVIAGAVFAALIAAAPAQADNWYPHPSDAQWQYEWTDSTYNTAGTIEDVTVGSENDPSGCGWTLQWSAPSASLTGLPDSGTACFADQDFGVVNTDWTSTPPPADMPILCATVSGCPNSLASALYNVIWGSRSPVLSEPLLQGTTWSSTGGASNEVTSTSSYLGLELVKVPAFPSGVVAAAVRSQIALGGTFGDDYGSGTRTTWWVYGVGPVKVEFDHVDGSVSDVSLLQTNLTPMPALPDQNYFPLTQGLAGTYKWTNSKHLRQPEIEKVSIDAVSNRSARIDVKSVSGPIRVVGSYGFTARLDGVRNIFGSTSAASLAKFPSLGHGRHFFTPIDLMTYGFNPLLPAYPVPGSSWKSGDPRDFKIYGVSGTTALVGVRWVRVPAGRFRALEIRSVLKQPGHPFGSGVRTMWFAQGRGLVKLVFQHRDGSTSVIELIR